MHELVVNLHMHTTYSDGSGTHADLARAALRTGVDVLLVTDHNTWVEGLDGYRKNGKKRVLVLVGEEVHDQDREPQKNHLLIFGAGRELSTLADNPQAVIDAARSAGGLVFLAHPVDPALPAFGETDISWVDWNVHSYTGLELWNGFSELKVVVKNKLQGLFYAYLPELIGRGPIPETLKIWDDLHAWGQRVVAVGGSDAHARHMSLGPIHKVIFPYDYHFSSVNTHILVPEPLSGDLEMDTRIVLAALESGHCFVGNDLPASTRGFRFLAHGNEKSVQMGDTIPLNGGVTLHVKLPAGGKGCRLIKDGKPVDEFKGEACSKVVHESGVYRIEAFINYIGRQRGWIYSNPIYIR